MISVLNIATFTEGFFLTVVLWWWLCSEVPVSVVLKQGHETPCGHETLVSPSERTTAIHNGDVTLTFSLTLPF